MKGQILGKKKRHRKRRRELEDVEKRWIKIIAKMVERKIHLSLCPISHLPECFMTVSKSWNEGPELWAGMCFLND